MNKQELINKFDDYKKAMEKVKNNIPETGEPVVQKRNMVFQIFDAGLLHYENGR